MDELTLGEKDYLTSIILKYNRKEENAYKIAEYFTRLQRGKFLRHYFQKEHEEAKNMIDNIKNLQAHI